MNLLGKRIFTGVIKLKIVRSSWIRMGPKPNDSVLGDTFTDLQRWEAQVLVTQVCAHAEPHGAAQLSLRG